MTEAGANQAFDQALVLSLDPFEEEALEYAAARTTTDGPSVKPKAPADKNGTGSYERFMTSFGMPSRWAGGG